ncbi:MAG: hypothetical protein ACD_79C00803G0001 [uncultured bacterium]|nr:MAG: hypothetical protein ACD_79C00803G0001 [uncultured bacterium]
MIAGIIGASGYTGRELVKILLNHKGVSKINVYGRNSGVKLSKEIPELKNIYDDEVLPLDPVKIISETDVVFIALPHKVSMEYSPLFQDKVLLIDLSADYRLNDAALYQKHYENVHIDPGMLGKYVYGLPEIFREDISKAKKIANPGCYPTSIILGILPLVEKGLIGNSFISDSKSGHSGAGKKLSETLHGGNLTNNIQPYKISSHQHIGEIEQILTAVNDNKKIHISFTPQVLPFDRGILSCIYADLTRPVSKSEIEDIYKKRYDKEPFVRLFFNEIPSLKNCQYTNFCDIGFFLDERLNRITIVSCIDNLIKGASGQAVQNMNIALGFNEKEGLI